MEDNIARAVLYNEPKTVERLVRSGMGDPNQRDQYTGATLLHTAVWIGAGMVELLIELGANPMLEDPYGTRPYHWSLSSDKYEDVRTLLLKFEPAGQHDEDTIATLARRFGAPEPLIDRLRSDKLSLGEIDGVALDLLPLQDVYIFTFEGVEYLVISASILQQPSGFYFSGPIVWNQEARRVCGLDIEHDAVGIIGTWDRLVSDTFNAIMETNYSDEWLEENTVSGTE